MWQWGYWLDWGSICYRETCRQGYVVDKETEICQRNYGCHWVWERHQQMTVSSCEFGTISKLVTNCSTSPGSHKLDSAGHFFSSDGSSDFGCDWVSD
jgi:hypothetical protein